MNRLVRRRTVPGLIACALAVPLAIAGQQAPAQRPVQQPPLIRSQVTMVPIDVRVIGRDGAPVTDLTAGDFTILEDGVPQVIRHFSTQAFTADSDAPARPPQFRRAIEDPTDIPNRRVFLIMLGRGRHQAVSKYVEALSGFVTEQLMPQDQVALMAWNGATDFTSDHAMIARTLARYRERHEKIELQLREWFSGLRAVYGSPDIPPQIQKQIDDVYGEALALRPRSLTPAPETDTARRLERARRTGDEIQRDELLKTFPDASFLPDMGAEITAALAGLSFDEYVERSSETMQDLGGLYAAIDYLRYLEGEKHILFLTEHGIDLPNTPGNRVLATVASDARIAINIVQTGGVVGAPTPRYVLGPNGSRLVMSALPSFNRVSNQSFSTSDLRTVAEITGGRLVAYTRGPEAFARLHRTLGFQYLLAYAPAKAATDGKFRQIEIKVRRPGVQLQYRRGYLASPRIVPLDRREFVTFTRIRAAARYDRTIDHIRVSLARRTAQPADPKAMDVEVNVDISKLALPVKDGVRTGVLDVAVYCGDAKEAPVGEALSRVDLTFSEAAYRRALETGAWFVIRVPLRGTPRRVKAVVYDYGADLVGSTVAEMPLPASER